MTTTTTTLDGYFKERYGSLEDVVPEHEVLARDIPFSSQDKLGDSYRFPVRMRRAHGHTFSSGGTAFALNAVVSGLTQEASVSGTEYVLREQVAYAVASRAQSSKEAFGNGFDEVVHDMHNSASFARELCMLYGGTDIGTITADPGTGPGSRTVVITEATWAPGLWAQMEGASVDIYSAAGGTQRNSTSAVVVEAVDVETRTITLGLGTESDLDDIEAGDVIIPFNADGNWFSGVDKIASNTGTLFGIAGATYKLWLAGAVACGSAALTMAKVTTGGAKIAVKSGHGKVCVYMSSFTWNDLNNDHASLRRLGESTKKGVDLGTESIKYYGANGLIELKPHPMVKAGEAFMCKPSTSSAWAPRTSRSPCRERRAASPTSSSSSTRARATSSVATGTRRSSTRDRPRWSSSRASPTPSLRDGRGPGVS